MFALRLPDRPGWALTVVLLAALALRLALLGVESYWYDEIWALNQVRGPLAEVLRSLAAEDVHPPLYPIVLWGWVRLVGEAEVATRLLSVLLGTGAVGLTYLLGRDLYDKRTGLVAAALVALNGFAVYYARETRAYSLLLFAGVLATWALVRWALRPHDRRRAVLYAAAAAALAYTHVYGSFLLLAHGVFALHRLPRLRRPFLVVAAAVGVLFTPWVAVLLGQVSRVQAGFWIDPIGWKDPFVWAFCWAGYNAPMLLIFAWLIARGSRDRTPSDATPIRRHRRALLWWWIGLSVGLPVALSVVGQPIFHFKYPITITAPLMLLAARGLLTLKLRWRRPVAWVSLALMVLGTIYTVHVRTNKEQWRELAALADAAAREGTVLVAEAEVRPYVSYYLPPGAEIIWLDDDADVAEAERRARASRADLLYLQMHPMETERAPRLEKRWARLYDQVLVGGKATRFRVR